MKVFEGNNTNSLTLHKFPQPKTTVVESQASVPVENRMARRTDKNAGADERGSEFVVEKILAKRFNPRKKQYEYLLKWEGYAQ